MFPALRDETGNSGQSFDRVLCRLVICSILSCALPPCDLFNFVCVFLVGKS
jgi:hypothetical protein